MTKAVLVLMKNRVSPRVHSQSDDGLKDSVTCFSEVDWAIVLGIRDDAFFVEQNEAAW